MFTQEAQGGTGLETCSSILKVHRLLFCLCGDLQVLPSCLLTHRVATAASAPSCCCRRSARTTRTASASSSTRRGAARGPRPLHSMSTSQVRRGRGCRWAGLWMWVELSGVSVLPTENNSPLGVPVINSSGPAYHIWKGVELAVSTFWPNHYQVKHARTPGLQALHCWGLDDVAGRQEVNAAVYFCWFSINVSKV